MNQDDIINMARQAGYGNAMAELHRTALTRFAALVAAAEREKCVEICELLINNNGSHDLYDEGCWDCAEFIRQRSEQFAQN